MNRTPLSRDWLLTIEGVAEKRADTIIDKYDSLEALASAAPGNLAVMLNGQPLLGQVLVLSARDLLRNNQQLAKDGEIPGPDTSAVDAQVAEAEEAEEDLYVIRPKRIDQFTVVRTREKVTPSVCTRCGYDAAVAMGKEVKPGPDGKPWQPWDQLGPAEQMRAKALLEEHQKLHTTGEAPLLTKSQLPTESRTGVSPF